MERLIPFRRYRRGLHASISPPCAGGDFASAVQQVAKHYVKFNRRNIYQRDNFTCQYCGKVLPRNELTIDHVIPRSRGAKSNWQNVVLACIQCNADKGDRLPKECAMNPMREPREPHWSMLMYRPLIEEDHTLWRKFVDVAYWNVTLEE